MLLVHCEPTYDLWRMTNPIVSYLTWPENEPTHPACCTETKHSARTLGSYAASRACRQVQTSMHQHLRDYVFKHEHSARYAALDYGEDFRCVRIYQEGE